jgi:hypothetical protein
MSIIAAKDGEAGAKHFQNVINICSAVFDMRKKQAKSLPKRLLSVL